MGANNATVRVVHITFRLESVLELVAPWLLPMLACPLHHSALQHDQDQLCCEQGCEYPLVHGVPVLLSERSADFPHDVFGRILTAIKDGSAWYDYGNSEANAADTIDPWVAKMVGATNSQLYQHLVDKLQHYPLPAPPFNTSENDGLLLDLGCGWGRWSLSAAANGQQTIGIDPSLGSVLAATRVARQLGLADKAAFVVADARFPPFRDNSFQRAWSYSVFQHFPKQAVDQSLQSLQRVMVQGGQSRIHLLNTWGLRSLQVQLVRGFRQARGFEVRYWRPAEMLSRFNKRLGPGQLEVGSFFVQAQNSDRHMLTPAGRRLLDLSATLTRFAKQLPLMTRLADNLFIHSRIKKSDAPSR